MVTSIEKTIYEFAAVERRLRLAAAATARLATRSVATAAARQRGGGALARIGSLVAGRPRPVSAA